MITRRSIHNVVNSLEYRDLWSIFEHFSDEGLEKIIATANFVLMDRQERGKIHE